MTGGQKRLRCMWGGLKQARSLICNFQVPAFVSQQSCARLMRSDFIPPSSLLGSNIRETRQSTKSNLPEEFIPHAIKGQSCRQSCPLIGLNVPICLFNRRLSIDLVVWPLVLNVKDVFDPSKSYHTRHKACPPCWSTANVQEPPYECQIFGQQAICALTRWCWIEKLVGTSIGKNQEKGLGKKGDTAFLFVGPITLLSKTCVTSIQIVSKPTLFEPSSNSQYLWGPYNSCV